MKGLSPDEILPKPFLMPVLLSGRFCHDRGRSTGSLSLVPAPGHFRFSEPSDSFAAATVERAWLDFGVTQLHVG